MKMIKKLFSSFVKNESGAVTVDFVVLTAAVVVMGGLAATTLSTKLSTAATGINLAPAAAPATP